MENWIEWVAAVRVTLCVPRISWFNPLILINVFLPPTPYPAIASNSAVSNYIFAHRLYCALYIPTLIFVLKLTRSIDIASPTPTVSVPLSSGISVHRRHGSDGVRAISHGSDWMASSLINPNWILSKISDTIERATCVCVCVCASKWNEQRMCNYRPTPCKWIAFFVVFSHFLLSDVGTKRHPFR